MLLSQPISSELCVSRCYRGTAHLHCRQASCLGYYLKEMTGLKRGVRQADLNMSAPSTPLLSFQQLWFVNLS